MHSLHALHTSSFSRYSASLLASFRTACITNRNEVRTTITVCPTWASADDRVAKVFSPPFDWLMPSSSFRPIEDRHVPALTSQLERNSNVHPSHYLYYCEQQSDHRDQNIDREHRLENIQSQIPCHLPNQPKPTFLHSKSKCRLQLSPLEPCTTRSSTITSCTPAQETHCSTLIGISFTRSPHLRLSKV